MKKYSNLCWLWLSLSIVIIDQITKYFAVKYLVLFRSYSIFPFFDLSLQYNTGIAFSLLDTASGWQRWILSVSTVVIGYFIFIWMKRTSPNRRFLLAALASILGGAIGNLVDRLYQGYVIDFIDLHIKHWHWPTFNIADMAISVGVILLIVVTFLEKKN